MMLSMLPTQGIGSRSDSGYESLESSPGMSNHMIIAGTSATTIINRSNYPSPAITVDVDIENVSDPEESSKNQVSPVAFTRLKTQIIPPHIAANNMANGASTPSSGASTLPPPFSQSLMLPPSNPFVSGNPFAKISHPSMRSSDHDDMVKMSGGNKDDKQYLCQRCLNHREMHPRKGHKPFCRYADCPCQLCTLVDVRRVLNNKISRASAQPSEDNREDLRTASGDTKPLTGRVRQPLCARCQVHGIISPLRGHKKRCKYNNCTCHGCMLVAERRMLMSRQIKVRRVQRNEINRVKEIDGHMKAFISNQMMHQTCGSHFRFADPPMPPMFPPPLPVPTASTFDTSPSSLSNQHATIMARMQGMQRISPISAIVTSAVSMPNSSDRAEIMPTSSPTTTTKESVERPQEFSSSFSTVAAPVRRSFTESPSMISNGTERPSSPRKRHFSAITIRDQERAATSEMLVDSGDAGYASSDRSDSAASIGIGIGLTLPTPSSSSVNQSVSLSLPCVSTEALRPSAVHKSAFERPKLPRLDDEPNRPHGGFVPPSVPLFRVARPTASLPPHLTAGLAAPPLLGPMISPPVPRPTSLRPPTSLLLESSIPSNLLPAPGQLDETPMERYIRERHQKDVFSYMDSFWRMQGGHPMRHP